MPTSPQTLEEIWQTMIVDVGGIVPEDCVLKDLMLTFGQAIVLGEGVTSFNTRTAAVTLESTDVSGAGGSLNANNLSDLASESTARTNLGLGTAATQAAGYFAQVANNLSDLASESTARTNLGLGAAAVEPLSAFLQPTNNLSDVASAATSITNLGLSKTKVPLVGTSGALVGSPPAAGAPNFQMQAGIASITASSGNFSLTFPTAFTSGIICCLLTPNNDAGNSDVVDNIAASAANAVTGQFWRAGSALTGSAQVQYIAIGF